MASPRKLTVVITDQHAAMRLGVRTALARDRSLRVVGEAENGREAVKLARQLQPDVVISGISMPLLNGLEAARQIMAGDSKTRVLIFSAQTDDKFIERAIERVEVSGYVLKSHPVETLPAAVRAVAEGRTAFSPEIISHLKRHKMMYSKREPYDLTVRELEVIQLVTEGYMDKEIGDILDIGYSRVLKLMEQIRKKLNVKDRSGIVVYGKDSGLSQGHVN